MCIEKHGTGIAVPDQKAQGPSGPSGVLRVVCAHSSGLFS